MAIASAQKRSSTGATKVLSANSTVLQFNSTLEDGGFSATGEDTHWIEESKRELRANNCIAIPTETVYGLAANALSSDAVKQIYKVKGRPSDNPLIVHVSSIRMLRALYHLPAAAGAAANGGLLLDPIMPFLGTNNAAMEGEELTLKLNEAESRDGAWPEIPKAYHEVIKRFWPGPLTIIMPRPQCIPIEVLGGHGDTVAFRFPSHPVARAIISACGLPLAAPSANASGRPSPTQAQHVKHDLDGRLPLIVDAGACDVGVESTVLDAFSKNAYVDGQLSPCILRPGGVTFEELRQLDHGMWRRLRVYRRDFTSKEIEVNPTTPGMNHQRCE
ncbi:hypothetical protein GGI12_001938 [Dipsacomyces acuminosporus]|nr:hypothetical protein GGI12_001938 [Dipsacomyces acuminosporus]